MPDIRLDLQPKQLAAFHSTATEVLYGGAAGGGKSHLMRVAAIGWCLMIPGLQVYIFRRTYPDLWKNHMEGPSAFPAMLAAIPSVRITYNDGKIRFANGSTIHLCHCQYSKDVLSYQGAEIHVLMIDEGTQWPRDMYAYLRGRVRMVGVKAPEEMTGRFPRILVSANPGGIGHNWVKAAWVDLGPGQHKMLPADGGMTREYIPARLEDNPILSDSDPDYESRLSGLGNAALVRAMRLGDWDIVAGGAVDDVWDRERHVIPPFRIPSSWRIDRSFDWGSSKPFSLGWWAESDGTEATMADGSRKSWPRGTLFRIGEWYGWNGQANEGARIEDTEIGKGIAVMEKALREFLHLTQAIQKGPADSSIFDADPGKASIAHGINAGYWGRPGQSPDIFATADKSPGSRVRGLAVMRRYLKASLAERMEDAGLFIFDTCTHGFIRTVPVLPRDEKKPDDINTEAEDHAFDEARYRLLSAKHEARRVAITGV